MKTYRKYSVFFTLVLIFWLAACNSTLDAVDTAKQMTTTAADLSSYYSSLAQAISSTIDLYRLDSSLFAIPFDQKTESLLTGDIVEINKRERVATNLVSLASDMTTLSGNTLPSGVSASASALGKELIAVKALPSGSSVPDDVSKAGNALIQAIQLRKEREAAKALDQTTSAITALFMKENPTYDSIFEMYTFEASQVASGLIDKKVVDTTPLLDPALKPFGLVALPGNATLASALQGLAQQNLSSAKQQADQKEALASSAMLSSLQDMSSRVHQLATGKSASPAGKPESLHVVEKWAESAF